MADTVVAFVLIVVCSFSTLFLCSSRKSNEFFFLVAASVMSRLEIVEVSMVGKHFLYQNKSENHAMLKI